LSGVDCLVGRLFLSAIFLFSGFGKIADWSGTSAAMEKQGMVAVPLFLAGAIALEIFGGLSVLLGFFARWGAACLVIFLVPATFIFHDFWTVEEGMARMNQMQHFMKNFALLGGLLMVAAFGAGRFSLDHWRASRMTANETKQEDPVLVG
jgi:putative oxidoreductase